MVQTGGNTPPTANAGEDQSVEVNQTIQINGTGNDSDGTIVSYQWSNDSVVVANTASFTYTPDTVESQTLTLTVTDNNGTTASDEMVLTVTAVPLPNTPPTANAGVDKSTQVNQSVTINGTGNDSDGSITSYEWISGSTVLSNSASFTYTPTIEGNETLTLTVTDNEGATASDDMLLTVTPAPIETNAFTDNFQTNTISEYITEDTWTASGTGSLLYDGTSQRARLLTGDNIALAFSKTLPSTIEGSFSIDFLPTKYYPNGGIFTLKLIQDANNYYQIENTDNYGTREVAKYVNGVKVEAKPFTAEYTQGINYTITVNFSPESTNIEAFGQTIILDTNNAEIDVVFFLFKPCNKMLIMMTLCIVWYKQKILRLLIHNHNIFKQEIALLLKF